MPNKRAIQPGKRDLLFLRGPVRFGWIKKNIPDPASRLMLVAWGFMNMSTPAKTKLDLTLKVYDCAGIENPDQRSRVLKKIDKSVSDCWVERRAGRTVVLHQGRKPNENSP